MESARFAAAMGVSECTMCRLAPPLFDRAVSFASYDGEMRRMMHLLKFEGMRGIAGHVLGDSLARAAQELRTGPDGRRMAAAGRQAESNGRGSQPREREAEPAPGAPGRFAADHVLVVPVPLFATREKKRGYNQARLLAEAAIAALRRREPDWKLQLCPGVLVRVKDTPTLYALNPRQRRTGLRGAFAVPDQCHWGSPELPPHDAACGTTWQLIDSIDFTGLIPIGPGSMRQVCRRLRMRQ